MNNKLKKPISPWIMPNGSAATFIAWARHSESGEELAVFVTENSPGVAYACPKEDFFLKGKYGRPALKKAAKRIKNEPQDRQPTELSVWKHFKGPRSIVLKPAVHTVTGEFLVVYRCFGNKEAQTNHPDGIYARPLDMFLSLTDMDKYPEALQQYRFEKISEV